MSATRFLLKKFNQPQTVNLISGSLSYSLRSVTRPLHISSILTSSEPKNPDRKQDPKFKFGKHPKTLEASSNLEDESSQKLVENENLDPSIPPKNALKKAFIAEFCIFFVFGFFDNFIMMTIGESLDLHLGKMIPHAMLAAAFGNWISDLFGLVTGERVEAFMNKFYPAPKLSFEQLAHKKFHNSKHFLLGYLWGV